MLGVVGLVAEQQAASKRNRDEEEKEGLVDLTECMRKKRKFDFEQAKEDNKDIYLINEYLVKTTLESNRRIKHFGYYLLFDLYVSHNEGEKDAELEGARFSCKAHKGDCPCSPENIIIPSMLFGKDKKNVPCLTMQLLNKRLADAIKDRESLVFKTPSFDWLHDFYETKVLSL